MVRRAAAQNLGKFMLHLKMDKVQDMVPLLQQLSTDTQDSVRLLAVQSLADANFADSPAFTARVFMPLLKSGSTDMSWYVYYSHLSLLWYIHSLMLYSIPTTLFFP
jgi:hypothetical protein